MSDQHNQRAVDKAASKPVIRLVHILRDLGGIVVIAILALVARHFISQMIAIVVIVTYAVSVIMSRHKWHFYFRGLFTISAFGVLISVLIPLDVAIRDGSRWQICLMRVENSHLPELAPIVGPLRYRTDIVPVRHAVVFIVPSSRLLFTPLFAHPEAPFVIGSRRARQTGSGHEKWGHY
jgi:hypothetical protein